MRSEMGRIYAVQGEPDWRLLDGNGSRITRRRVNFGAAFAETPGISVSLSSFDILDGQNSRLTVYAEGASRNGFEVVFQTWADTRVWSASVAWIAIGS